MVSRMITLDDVININYDKAVSVIEDFIKKLVDDAGANGVVVGVSGGIDSSVALRLAIDALGPDKVHTLIMPDSRTTPKKDVEDALNLVSSLGVKHDIIWIDRIVDSYSIIPIFDIGNKIATGNLRARIRMCILYYYANAKNLLVLGTGDRSELLIGYYTKYGDGGVDALPLGSLYKTQVRHLGRILGLPRDITEKPSSPRLWPGHLAEEELGLKYEEIDVVLYAILDKKIPIDKVPELTGIDSEKVFKIIRMHRTTRHKRKTPPIPRLPWIREPLPEI